MTSIDIVFDGDGCWPDLDVSKAVLADITGVALLPDAAVFDTFTGRESCKPAMTIRLQLADGRIGLVQIKVEMFEMIARAMRGRLEYLAALRKAGKGEA